jgi:hypothetical protein
VAISSKEYLAVTSLHESNNYSLSSYTVKAAHSLGGLPLPLFYGINQNGGLPF